VKEFNIAFDKQAAPKPAKAEPQRHTRLRKMEELESNNEDEEEEEAKKVKEKDSKKRGRKKKVPSVDKSS
jgi:hypothetical protein